MTARRFKRPSEAASAAAEAIRQINHLILDGTQTAPEISAAVQALVSMVDRLPQTMEQLAHQVRHQRDEGNIRMDDRTDVDENLTEVLVALDAVLVHLAGVSHSLHRAAAPLWHMAAK